MPCKYFTNCYMIYIYIHFYPFYPSNFTQIF